MLNTQCVAGAKRRYIASRRSTPAGEVRWCSLFPMVETWSWSLIWRLSDTLQVPHKIKAFQFKLLHQILAAPSKMHVWGMRDSAVCYACGADKDSIEHMLVLCPWSMAIWTQVLERFQRDESVAFTWSPEHLLFGFVQPILHSETQRRLNTIILLAKHYIYSQRRAESFSFSAVAFRFVLQRYIYCSNSTRRKQ